MVAATPAGRSPCCRPLWDLLKTPGQESSGETAEPELVGAEEIPFMGDRLIISDNREDHGNPLVLAGVAIDPALNQ